MRANTNKVFADSSYLIALASARDELHDEASRLFDHVLMRRIGMVSTRAVLIEFANFLARPELRKMVVKVVDDFERDPSVEIVPLSEDLFGEAFDLFRHRMDKSWGLTDCISFVVMRERGISEALTADEHFEQAGFIALLNQ
jgi:predicted nucleic acid-binding protein